MSFFTGIARKRNHRTVSSFFEQEPRGKRQAGGQSKKHREQPRLILSERGNILFANAEFYALYDGPHDTLQGLSAESLFENFKAQDGAQNLSLSYNGQKLALYFTWVPTRDGGRVLVASAEEGFIKPELEEYVSQIVRPKASLASNTQNRLLDFDINSVIANYSAVLVRQQKRLSEAEAIANMGQWHWRIGQDTLNFSDQLYTIFGLEPSGSKPTLQSINDMIHKNDAERMMQVFQRAIIEQKDYDMDFRIQTPAGETRYIRCEGRCQTDEEGDVNALYGIMQDVTETMEYQKNLRIAKETAERAYAAKSQFLANMSHELRTPLNAVIGFSEMMERQLLGPIGNEKYLEYIKGIRESGEHLLDLISDILDMSKIEAGKYELSLESFNITKIIKLAAHMMEGRALDGNIRLFVNSFNDQLQVTADRRAVMQMILNLLSNAIKFSKENGEVFITLKQKEKFYAIEVKDNGIGIPANKLASITMPFEQAEINYTKKYEGTGLGLSITKELAEIHGGELVLESRLDVGTTATLLLPYRVG